MKMALSQKVYFLLCHLLFIHHIEAQSLNWYVLSPRRYVRTPQSQNFEESVAVCASYGASLVKLDDAIVEGVVIDNVIGTTTSWIGLNASSLERLPCDPASNNYEDNCLQQARDAFRWTADGLMPSWRYNNWRDNTPREDVQQCVATARQYGGWNAFRCSERFPAVCERREACVDNIEDVTNGFYTPRLEYYPAGSTITYACNGGLAIAGQPTLTCTDDNNWTPRASTLQCVVPCPPPAILRAGYFLPEKDSFVADETVTYECNPGYRLVGTATFTCTDDNGQWSGDTSSVRCAETCVVNLFEIDNGSYEPRQTTYNTGDIITYSCDPGYELQGVARVLCLSDATWSEDLSTYRCDETCILNFVELENGDHSPRRETYDTNDVVTFTCNADYVLRGQAVVSCLANGRWSYDLSRNFCTAETCVDSLVDVPNGFYTPRNDFYSARDSVTYECNEGYFLLGEARLTCTDGRFWSSEPSAVRCVVPCPAPAAVQNGFNTPIKDVYVVGDTVTYECNPGYRLVGIATFTCEDASGRWSSDTSTSVRCADTCLVNLVEIDNGNYEPRQSVYNTNDVVTYSCDFGYELRGQASVSCRTDGLWSQDLTTYRCAETCLKNFVELENGDHSPRQSTYNTGDVVTYTCNSGYLLRGQGRVTCLSNASWSHDLSKNYCAASCIQPPLLENGNFAPVKLTYASPDVITYVCKTNFTLIGASRLECFRNGSWGYDGEPAQCRVSSPPVEGNQTLAESSSGGGSKSNIPVIIGAVCGVLVLATFVILLKVRKRGADTDLYKDMYRESMVSGQSQQSFGASLGSARSANSMASVGSVPSAAVYGLQTASNRFNQF